MNTALDNTLRMSKEAFSSVSVIAWMQCLGIVVQEKYLLSLLKLHVHFIAPLKISSPL